MHFLVLALLSADPQPALRIEVAGSVLVLKVDGKTCDAVKHKAAYAAAQEYLAGLRACVAPAHVIAADLKGSDVAIFAASGTKNLGRVACGLRPPEGALRIQAGTCSGP